MSETRIATPPTLVSLDADTQVSPGGLPVPSETRVSADQETILGDGSSLSPLRAVSAPAPSLTFGATLADGESIALPSGSDTTVLEAAIAAGQITADKFAIVSAIVGVMWDLPFTAETQASISVVVEFDDGVHEAKQVGTALLAVNPEQPPTAGTSLGPGFYQIPVQGILPGESVAGAAGVLRIRVLVNQETDTYQLVNGGGGSPAVMSWTVVPAANVQQL